MANREMFGRVREAFFPSRKAPVRVTTQARQVRDKMFGGSSRTMANAYGVSQRTVERWISGTRTPTGLSKAAERRWEQQNAERARQGRPALPRPATSADRLATDAVQVQTTERGRERKAKQLERRPISGLHLRVGRAATFEICGSSAVRSRDVHLALTGDQAARLVRADNEDEIRDVIGEALADYFNGGVSGGFGPNDFHWEENDFDIR